MNAEGETLCPAGGHERRDGSLKYERGPGRQVRARASQTADYLVSSVLGVFDFGLAWGFDFGEALVVSALASTFGVSTAAVPADPWAIAAKDQDSDNASVNINFHMQCSFRAF